METIIVIWLSAYKQKAPKNHKEQYKNQLYFYTLATVNKAPPVKKKKKRICNSHRKNIRVTMKKI